MNGRSILSRRRHSHSFGGRLGLIAAVILTGILLRPQPVLPDPEADCPKPAYIISAERTNPASSRQTPAERVMVMEATAYSYTGSRTFTGTWPQRGTVAVDPEVIPLGSRLHVEGYGPGRAEDTGGAIKGNIVDVYVESEAAAREWGRRQVEVRVLVYKGKCHCCNGTGVEEVKFSIRWNRFAWMNGKQKYIARSVVCSACNGSGVRR